MFRRICVFCGSSTGNRPVFGSAARKLGALLADSDIGLVYGGGNVGLMNEVAAAALEHGGEVIGIIPAALADRDLAHRGLSEIRIVNSMHDRKAQMAELSDGFIAMPGGLGTLEELFEVLAWAHLGFHEKPCGLLNVEGYYRGLLSFLGNTVAAAFLGETQRQLLIGATEPERLLQKMAQARVRE